jgi:undecaprenyl diphosphate synthase
MPESKKPRHIAVIMDGNGRWAVEQGLPRIAGHQAGTDAVRKTLEQCLSHGIEVLTLFAFSRENWGRPAEEVEALMQLFISSLREETVKLHQQKIRVCFMGERSKFSKELQDEITKTEQLTAGNQGLTLVIAANYSGRWDIVQACQKLAASGMRSDQINESTVQHALSLSEFPEPDLLIRTSGEVRISNFLLWQIAYSELYFCEVCWPDFDETQFKLALDYYATRIRRFGLSEPVLNPEGELC